MYLPCLPLGAQGFVVLAALLTIGAFICLVMGFWQHRFHDMLSLGVNERVNEWDGAVRRGTEQGQ